MKVIQLKLYEFKCLRCRKTWNSKVKKPRRCGKCKSPYYATRRKPRRIK